MKHMLNQKGSLLVEVLVSIGFAALATIAIASVVSMTIRLNRASAYETRAAAYAKESLEQFIALKKESWVNVNKTPGKYLITPTATGYVLNPDSGSPAGEVIEGTYRRSLDIRNVCRDGAGVITATCSGPTDPNVKKATVTITWPISGPSQRSVSIHTYVTNWKGES